MILLRPRLFYLLDYGFLPQNVSEVGGKKPKKLLRDPKVQIITVGHYCNLKMVVSHAQLLFANLTIWDKFTLDNKLSSWYMLGCMMMMMLI
jgi:hypothetical protein